MPSLASLQTAWLRRPPTGGGFGSSSGRLARPKLPHPFGIKVQDGAWFSAEAAFKFGKIVFPCYAYKMLPFVLGTLQYVGIVGVGLGYHAFAGDSRPILYVDDVPGLHVEAHILQ